MPFDPVLLKTDFLFFLLLAVFIGYAFYARKREHLLQPWREVIRHKLGMVSAVVLGFYLLVAVLDSIHFYPALDTSTPDDEEQYSTEILSMLDTLAGPLRTRAEKTYSAPFAAHLHAKETIELGGGNTARIYPRLLHGGAHLSDPETEKWPDIIQKTGLGLMEGLLVWGFGVCVFVLLYARMNHQHWNFALRNIWTGETSVPWIAVLVTFGIIIALIFICGNLCFHYHIFGTDKVGVDVFYQALKSIRTGLLIGTITTLVMLPFAVVLGVMAGYFRGWIDDLIQYLYTTLSSIPGVLLIASAALLLDVYMARHADEFTSVVARADLRLLFLCLILGITSWTGLCRLLRGEALKLREVDYIEAARAFGIRDSVILARHMLPNVMHIIMIAIVLDFSGLVLAEAVLSYINIGVDPTMESWGNMINSARFEMAREPVVWWSLAAAFVFMLGLVLSANLFADAVRDAFDPRLRKQITN